MRPLLVLLLLGVTVGCRSGEPRAGEQTLVFVHQPLGGDPAPFAALLDGFRAAHPGVTLKTQLLPNASDVAHQYFVTGLEGEAPPFDVFVVDVVWAQEFARAGWTADLSATHPPEDVRDVFIPGAAEAAIFDGGTYAVPWYVDVGLLYFRTDLVPRAPRTYAELASFAREAKERDPALAGYVFQGRQYEGLVCNVYERIWGHGGESLSADGRVLLETPEAARALASLRALVVEGVAPASATSAAEEEARRSFNAGRAVFMRNWPYAHRELSRPDSPVRGRFEVAALPSEDGGPGPGTLGGWQLAASAHLPEKKRALAAALISHLTSEEANLTMALHYGRNPARRAAYESEALRAQAPFVASLLPHVEAARPRPTTPYYGLFSDALQSEFSAALSGIRTPEEALSRAQEQVDRVMGGPLR